MNTLNNLPSRVKLVDVGPRDGLQNEKQMVPAAVKIGLIDRLQQAGVRHLEATSFVSPKWVPQMGDAVEVMAGLPRRADVVYSVLTPNMKGFEGALAAGANEVVVFGAATQAFSRRNINCSIEESIERFAPVVAAAREAGLKVRAAISCALGCPYQGEVSADEVEHLVKLFKAIGVHHCGVADTIGVGTPRRAQGTLVTDGETRKVARFLKDVAEPSFERQLISIRGTKAAGGEESDGGCAATDGGERDPMFDKAVEIMIESGRGSVSLLQRRLAIGYGRASRLVDQMGQAGILSDHKGSVAREVLISLDDWKRMQSMVESDAAGGGSEELRYEQEDDASVPDEFEGEYRN